MVDLDLVEPAGVDRGVDEDHVPPALLQSLDRCLAAVIGAVVDDPEHAAGGAVGLFGHHLPHQPVECSDPARAFGASHHSAAAHVPGVEVGDGAEPLVLVLDQLTTARSGRGAGMDPPAGLDRRFRVRADHTIAGLQQLALPAARIQVEHPPGLLKEVRVAREDPRAVLPRLDRVLCQPAADRRRRRVAHATLHDEPVQLRATEARERDALLLGQLARDRLDLGDLLRGEAARAARAFPVIQSIQALVVKASSPPADKLGHHPQPGADLNIAQPLSRIQHELGSLHLTVRPRVARRAMLQLAPLLVAQIDLIPAAARHHQSDSLR